MSETTEERIAGSLVHAWRHGRWPRPEWWIERELDRLGWAEDDDGRIVRSDGGALDEEYFALARFGNPLVDALADIEEGNA